MTVSILEPMQRDWRGLADYLHELRNAMGLRDWYFRISQERPERDTAVADICVVPNRRLATVRVSAGFWDDTPETQRATVVHELLHPHLESVEQVLTNAQTDLGDAWGVLDGCHRDAIEQAVDAIAEAWAETLPLPPWARETKTPVQVAPPPQQPEPNPWAPLAGPPFNPSKEWHYDPDVRCFVCTWPYHFKGPDGQRRCMKCGSMYFEDGNKPHLVPSEGVSRSPVNEYD